MSYKVLRTDKADEQLHDIIFYIAEDSGSVDIALNYLEKIENSILDILKRNEVTPVILEDVIEDLVKC